MDPASRASLSSAWRWFALAAALVLADQLTKALVLGRFALGERLEITAFFNMVLVYNKGAAFSFLSDAAGWQTPLLIGFALVAIAVVGTLLVRSPGRRLLCAGLALILGGALGLLLANGGSALLARLVNGDHKHSSPLSLGIDWRVLGFTGGIWSGVWTGC